LAVLIVARHADDAEVFTLGTEDLNAGSGQRIKAAFAVDDETICASYDSWEIIRTFTSAFVNSEIPAIAQSPIGIDIERQHVQAVGVVQETGSFHRGSA